VSFKWIQVRYSESLLFRKSTIPTNPKADPNPNPHLNPNVSTAARIDTMDFRNSGPLEYLSVAMLLLHWSLMSIPLHNFFVSFFYFVL